MNDMNDLCCDISIEIQMQWTLTLTFMNGIPYVILYALPLHEAFLNISYEVPHEKIAMWISRRYIKKKTKKSSLSFTRLWENLLQIDVYGHKKSFISP